MGPPSIKHRRVAPITAALSALVGCSVLVGCSTPTGGTSAGSTAATTASRTPPTTGSASNSGQASTLTGAPFTVTAHGTFNNPWALTFLPSGNLLVSEKGGKLLLRNQQSGQISTVIGTPTDVQSAGQGGLGDIALSPNFQSDKVIYLSWVQPGANNTSGAVIGRGTFEEASARISDLKVIWQQTPKVSGNGHYSQRMVFSPDGRYLFVSSGDRQKMTPAQDLSNNLGKILRLNPDGSAASGNPFADRGGVAAEIWSYGHRNPLGLAFDAAGNLWEDEMGPRGGDEVNLILPGRNYGWPKASNGSNYDGSDIPDHRSGDGFEAPKASWNPAISPACLMIYQGTEFPEWNGDALVCALSGQALIRVHLDGTTATVAQQWPMNARIRAAAQAPDQTVWLLEDGPNARLLQLTPA